MSVWKNKKTNKWDAQTSYLDWCGSRRTKFKRSFSNKESAEEWCQEIKLSRSHDLDMTFSQFVKVYEEDRRPRLKEHTWYSKEYIINDKLLPPPFWRHDNVQNRST